MHLYVQGRTHLIRIEKVVWIKEVLEVLHDCNRGSRLRVSNLLAFHLPEPMLSRNRSIDLGKPLVDVRFNDLFDFVVKGLGNDVDV